MLESVLFSGEIDIVFDFRFTEKTGEIEINQNTLVFMKVLPVGGLPFGVQYFPNLLLDLFTGSNISFRQCG